VIAEKFRLGGYRIGKLLRKQDIATQLLGQGFQARAAIDGGPHYGEIEAVGSAHVAVNHLADVEPDAELNFRETVAAAAMI